MLSAISPMTLMWLVALILFGIAEAATVGLVSIWFAAGAAVAMIVSALSGPIWLQVLVFLVVSIVLLALLRPFVNRVSNPNKQATNADRHIGQQALVIEEINNLEDTGAVKLDGVVWSARSEQGETIPVGRLIEVKRIAGVKLYVAEVPKTETASVSFPGSA